MKFPVRIYTCKIIRAHLWLVVLTLVSFASSGQASITCSDLFSGQAKRSILSSLQERHQVSRNVFINQQDPRATPLSGGSCGPTCAVNLLQGLRESAGLAPEAQPYNMIRELFANLPILYRGNANPQSLHDAIEYLIKSHIPRENVQHKTEVLGGLDNRAPTWKDVQIVNQLTPEMIIPKSNEFKILLFGIVNPNGSLVGSHYILIKDSMGDQIGVIEPNMPELSTRFFYRPTILNQTFRSVELIPEPGYIFHEYSQRGGKFILFSVFTTTHH